MQKTKSRAKVESLLRDLVRNSDSDRVKLEACKLLMIAEGKLQATVQRQKVKAVRKTELAVLAIEQPQKDQPLENPEQYTGFSKGQTPGSMADYLASIPGIIRADGNKRLQVG